MIKLIPSQKYCPIDASPLMFSSGNIVGDENEQMISDFQDTFEEFYDHNDHDTPEEVENYGYYYMGCIICTGGSPNKIIDGQQRLTSLTLLLIYLNNLQMEQAKQGFRSVQFEDMIYDDHYGKKSFNIDVDERQLCLEALLSNDSTYQPDNESAQNMMDRYRDIADLFPDELKGEALEFFIYWLNEKVLLLEIDTPSEDEAHTIFLTMNDRGLSLNSAEIGTTVKRYRNTHYRWVIKLSRVCTEDQMEEAIEHCVKTGNCTAYELAAYLIYKTGEPTSRVKMKFYAEVLRVFPTYWEQDKWLKENGDILMAMMGE